MDYLKAGHTLGEFLEGFPSASREQAEGYLQMTLKADRQAPCAAGASRRETGTSPYADPPGRNLGQTAKVGAPRRNTAGG